MEINFVGGFDLLLLDSHLYFIAIGESRLRLIVEVNQLLEFILKELLASRIKMVHSHLLNDLLGSQLD
jgi:hypothetical protein